MTCLHIVRYVQPLQKEFPCGLYHYCLWNFNALFEAGKTFRGKVGCLLHLAAKHPQSHPSTLCIPVPWEAWENRKHNWKTCRSKYRKGDYLLISVDGKKKARFWEILLPIHLCNYWFWYRETKRQSLKHIGRKTPPRAGEPATKRWIKLAAALKLFSVVKKQRLTKNTDTI